MPGGVGAPMKHGNSRFLATGWFYTYFNNVTNWPTGNVPVTTVRKDEQYVEPNEFGDDRFNVKQRENQEGSEGLPIGVQVCGLPMHDEKVLAAMKIIDE